MKVTVYNKETLLVGWVEENPTPERAAELDGLEFAFTEAMVTEDWFKPKYVRDTDSFINDATELEQGLYLNDKNINYDTEF